MCNQINFNISSHGSLDASPGEIEQADERVANLMQQVIDQKEALTQAALKNRWNLSEVILIGGDLFSMGYLGFQGVQIVKSSLTAIPTIAFSTLVCGVVAGAINIGVAGVCLKEGIQASKNGDKKLALRLYVDFTCLLIIGFIMMLASLAMRVCALGAITAFFSANPWLLPVLFFVLSIPITIEIVNRIKNIRKKQNLAAQLNTPDLSKLIHGTNLENPFHLQPLIDQARHGVEQPFIKRALSEKMEQFQADMGVEAALETFRLMRLILKKEKTEEQFEKTKKKISEWNNAQYVRLLQQILYGAAFVVSLAALSPRINIPAVNGVETFSMAGANAIPLYMDTFWPFKRNTPIVVPMV